jgi:guanine deaminase
MRDNTSQKKTNANKLDAVIEVTGQTIYRARIFNPVSRSEFEDIEDGAIEVDEKGKISKIAKFSEFKDKKAKIIDYRGKIIMPGLIDCHVHLPQYDMVAMDGYELLNWLNEYTFPAERRFESPKLAKDAASRFFHALKANGTTTAAVYNTVHKNATDIAFEEAEKSGLRVFMGKVMMDQNSPDFLQEKTEESLLESEELCKKWHGRDNGRINYAFTPRFAPTCSEKLMEGVADLAKKYNAYIQTHLSENRSELSWVKELFPQSKNYTDVYYNAGILTQKTIMAHSIWVNPSELKLLAQTSTKVAHCASSNFFLKSGIFDLNSTLDAGVDVGLGSDVGGGPNLSLFREMSNACNMSKTRYIQENGSTKNLDSIGAFYLATKGGAKVLSLDKVIGDLTPGKEADFIVVDATLVDPQNGAKNKSGKEILSQLVYRADDRVVFAAYVRGKNIYSVLQNMKN